MSESNERFVVDENGTRVGVLLGIDDYTKLVEALEELESIRAYDAAKSSGDEAVSFDDTVREIEQNR